MAQRCCRSLRGNRLRIGPKTQEQQACDCVRQSACHGGRINMNTSLALPRATPFGAGDTSVAMARSISRAVLAGRTIHRLQSSPARSVTRRADVVAMAARGGHRFVAEHAAAGRTKRSDDGRPFRGANSAVAADLCHRWPRTAMGALVHLVARVQPDCDVVSGAGDAAIPDRVRQSTESTIHRVSAVSP